MHAIICVPWPVCKAEVTLDSDLSEFPSEILDIMLSMPPGNPGGGD